MLNETYIQAISQPEFGGDLNACARPQGGQSSAMWSFASDSLTNHKGGVTFS